MNLLLGNGVNLINDNKKFSSNSIAKRVNKLLPMAFLFFPATKNVFYLEKVKEFIDFENYNENIEQLFFDIYKGVILDKKFNYFNQMNDKKLLDFVDIIKKVLINAIFMDGIKFIKITVPNIIVNKIKTFNNIFTMNYYEYWDKENKAIYLHKKITYEEYRRSDFSIDEYKFKRDVDYVDAIETKLSYHMHFPIKNTNDLIMAPSTPSLNKQVMLNLSDSFESINGFYFKNNNPKNKKLYKELENLKEITIFGLSPFGDDLLIKVIRNIPKVKIYVYNIVINFKEAKKWKEEIPHANLIDSNKFVY